MREPHLPDSGQDDAASVADDQPRNDAESNVYSQIAETVGWVATGIAKALS